MFVQALAEYADNFLSEQLSEEAFEEKPVPYFIELDGTGTFLNRTENTKSVVRGKKTVTLAESLLIPRSPVARVAGVHPLLGVDDIKYVLGAGPWTKQGQEPRDQELTGAFATLIREAADNTNDDALKSCAAFYARPDQVDAARAAFSDAKAGTIVALSVNGPIIKRDRARDCWRNHYRAKADTDRVVEGVEAECLISGKVGPIARTHDKIKGLAALGGQAAGVSLMSFDKEAFRSYGWDQNQNSPVAPERAMAYVLALNDLLRHDRGHRKDIAGVGFIFWTKKPTEFNPMAEIDQPDPSQVERLLRFDPDADPDPNMFYMAGVAGNGGRMLIRYWVAETLGEVKGNLKSWFLGLRINNVFTGKPSEPPKFWQILRAIDREGEPPADRVVALVRRAIEGNAQPLGYRMLSAALARLRAAQGTERLNPFRIGLIRLCLNDQIGLRNSEGGWMPEGLDQRQRHPAYLCGRLMAVYEGLQYQAQGGEVGQTVVDRYYTLASTYPALAFPKMEFLGKKHLQKLRRDKQGARVAIEKEIDRLCGEIEEACGYRFPQALDLDGQGRFALGYHHQRAHHMAQAQERKQQDNGLSFETADQEKA
jgi:CRISPR-associated protein Csd1